MAPLLGAGSCAQLQLRMPPTAASHAPPSPASHPADGQTGTGKTHTMTGDIGDELSPGAGVIPRAIHQIFAYLDGIASEYSVKCSYLELYNEEITDLLTVGADVPKVRQPGATRAVDRAGWWRGERRKAGAAAPAGAAAAEAGVGVGVSAAAWATPRSFPLLPPACPPPSLPPALQVRIMEDRSGVVLAGIEESIVKNSHEIFALLEQGSAKRRTAETLLNKQSSRSHSGGRPPGWRRGSGRPLACAPVTVLWSVPTPACPRPRPPCATFSLPAATCPPTPGAVFIVTVSVREVTPEGDEVIRVGKLYLVDLAGSENITRWGAAGLGRRPRLRLLVCPPQL